MVLVIETGKHLVAYRRDGWTREMGTEGEKRERKRTERKE